MSMSGLVAVAQPTVVVQVSPRSAVKEYNNYNTAKPT